MRLAAGPKSTNLYNHISFITFKNIMGRNVTHFQYKHFNFNLQNL